MSPYILSPQAAADIEAVTDFYAERSPAYAEWLAGQLAKKFKLVGRFPRVGTLVDDLAPGLRKTPVGDVIVYFRAAPAGTEIVRVIHGAREVTAEDFTT